MKSALALSAALLAVGVAPAGAATPGTAPKAPKSAKAVTASTITWTVRESFIRYIATGQGTTVSGGAVAAAPRVAEGSDAPLVYDFAFPRRAGGWATAKRAVVAGRGALTFSHRMHGISLTFAKPTIVLRGAASTASFTVTGIDGKTATSPVLALDVTKAVRTVKGRTVTLTGIPATVAPTAGALFNGMYPAGAPFGSLTVRYTVAK